MSDNIKAFPLYEEGSVSEGMDLRDYFAGKVMQGDIANEAIGPKIKDYYLDELCDFYYRVADAMMEARER